ncbi:MAG: tetratricopeptide repeat protein [Prevotella sp.]|nr:tetratricopeptide repeat protein [Prevotella sp.]
MNIVELINHPERLDRDTLYELRSMLALYPYFQSARLLMLQNLYLLHAPSFDEELRRAAIYITDRKVIFNMVEAAHYRLSTLQKSDTTETSTGSDRTESLINRFLESIPQEEENGEDQQKKRKPTPADATVDYVAYLLESEEGLKGDNDAPQMKGQELIDHFLEQEKGKIMLSEAPEFTPQIEENNDEEEKESDEGYFTETLARIYIKQGRYSKALEIIRRLSLNYPKKNAYFADQIRFLEKLIINSNKNKK